MRKRNWIAVFATGACLLATSHDARAQYFIDLSKESMRLPPGAPYVDSVIVAFDQEAPIGEVMRGIGNTRTPALLPQMGQQIALLVDRSLTASSDAEHIFLKLDRLRIRERSEKNSEMTLCALNVEFGTITASGPVLRYMYGCTVWDFAFDATGEHARSIAAALEQAMNAYLKRDPSLPPTARSMQNASLRSPTDIRSLGFPGLSAKTFPKGIYHSYMDLLMLRSDSISEFTVKVDGRNTRGSAELRIKKDENYAARNAWGLSDGENLYINAGEFFLPVMADSSGLHLFASLERSANMDAVIAGAAIGGLVGSAIAGAASSQPSGPATWFDVDPMTGDLVPSTAHGTFTMVGGKQEWIFLYSKYSKRDVNTCLLLAGEEPLCLHRGQYHSVKEVPLVDGRPITVRTDDGLRTGFWFEPSHAGICVIEITIARNGAITVERAPDFNTHDLLEMMRPEDEVK